MTILGELDRRAAWHAARRRGIGGSDIPVLAGLSPYDATPHDIYLEKTGQIEPRPASPAMEVGEVIESAIAELYTRRTHRQLRRRGLVVHPEIPWAMGNIDRKVSGERRLVEIKNRRRVEGRDVPADVECQVQWYLGVTGWPVADVAMLVGGSDLRIREIAADPAYFSDLVTIGSDFWRRVEEGRPPELDGSAGAARYLAAKHPTHTSDELVAGGADVDAIVAEFRRLRAESLATLEELGAAENAIKALIGDAPGVTGPGYRIYWKRSADYAKVTWKLVAEGLRQTAPPDIYEHLVELYSETVSGARRFMPYFEGDTE